MAKRITKVETLSCSFARNLSLRDDKPAAKTLRRNSSTKENRSGHLNISNPTFKVISPECKKLSRYCSVCSKTKTEEALKPAASTIRSSFRRVEKATPEQPKRASLTYQDFKKKVQQKLLLSKSTSAKNKAKDGVPSMMNSSFKVATDEEDYMYDEECFCSKNSVEYKSALEVHQESNYPSIEDYKVLFSELAALYGSVYESYEKIDCLFNATLREVAQVFGELGNITEKIENMKEKYDM